MAKQRDTRHGGDAASEAYDEVASWVEPLARFGYGAKGVVYIMIGGLAVAAAIGTGGQTTGSSGALAAISESTPGRLMLATIAIGLFGYTLWGLVRATSNPENDGAAKRAYHGLTALLYGGLALEAGRMALNGGGDSGGGGSAGGDANRADHWSATLMQQPFGAWLLGAAGVGIVLFGVLQLIHAWKVDLDDHLDMSAMSSEARPWAVRAGRFGLAARGVVLGIIGGYVVFAAVQSDASEARGLEGVLDTLGQTPALLGVIAAGLVAYGVYSLVLAKYRRIRGMS